MVLPVRTPRADFFRLGRGGRRKEAGTSCNRIGRFSSRDPETYRFRRCPRCEREFALAEFCRDKSKPSGLRSICKECDRAKARAYYERVGRGAYHARMALEPRRLSGD
jgi:hypothetical protein